MKEYFVIFILFTIFILYSVTLVSKDLNRMRCIEGFEAPAPTFLQAIGGSACSDNQQMHYEHEHDIDTSTYQLQCYYQCSSTNTNVPVTTDGRSNCKLPSDSNTSNCEVSVSAKCYLDGDFHEISSNVNMYCPDSGYADCGQCDVTEGTCSSVGGTCQKTNLVTLPTGYARCTLEPSVYGVDHLTSDSNFVISCEQSQCTSGTISDGITGSSPVVTSPTPITDGSCMSLDCYGDAAYHSSGKFDITGKVLGIKIPQTSIKERLTANRNLDFKYVILNFERFNHDDSWNLDMSIGICKDTSKLINPLSTDIINNIKTIFQNNVDDPENTNGNRNHIQQALGKYRNTTIEGMTNDDYSAEVITLHGGGYGVYFNFIKEGNKFDNFYNADKVTDKEDPDLWIKHTRTRVRFEFRTNGTKVAIMHTDGRPEYNSYSMDLNADVSFTESDTNVTSSNIAQHYIFLKGGPSQNLDVSNLSFS